MKAKEAAKLLGMSKLYDSVISITGRSHKCNQGCCEGWCDRNEDAHQKEILKGIHKINTLKLNEIRRDALVEALALLKKQRGKCYSFPDDFRVACLMIQSMIDNLNADIKDDQAVKEGVTI